MGEPNLFDTARRLYKLQREFRDLIKAVQEHYLNHYTFKVVKWKGESPTDINTYTLAVRPEEVEVSYPTKSSVFQSLYTGDIYGGYVEDFGLAPPKITMSGTTGRKNRLVWMSMKGLQTGQWTYFPEEKQMMTGLEQVKFLRDQIFKASHNIEEAESGVTVTVYFYDWNMEEYWEVNIDDFSIRRSVSRNGLYMYRINMTALREIRKDSPQRPDSLVEHLKAVNFVRELEIWLSGFDSILAQINEKIFYSFTSSQGGLIDINKILGGLL